jgi:hypothetical protein
MKYIFHIMTMFVLSNAAILTNNAPEAFTLKNYLLEDLVETRLTWAHQENRLGQLKYEASNIATSHVVEYVAGNTHVASINANDKTITTHLKENKSVKLSYEEFSKLLCDQEIIDLANKRLRDEQAKQTGSSKGWFGSWFK